MALSMDEQRMLAEIERRLAARMSSFRRPRPAVGLRSTRGKIIGSLCAVVLLAAIAVMVYATLAVRAHTLKTPSRTTQSASSQAAGAVSEAKAVPTATTTTHIIGENGVQSHNG
jgi:hypothetical protein